MEKYDLFGKIMTITSLVVGGFLVYEHGFRSYEQECRRILAEQGSDVSAEFCLEDCRASNLVRMVKTGTEFWEAYKTAEEECSSLRR